MKIGTLVPKRVFNKEKMLASFYKALSQNVIIHHILTLQLKTPSVDTDVGAWCCVRDSCGSAAVTERIVYPVFIVSYWLSAVLRVLPPPPLIRRDIRQHLTTTFFAQLLSKSICLSIFVDMEWISIIYLIWQQFPDDILSHSFDFAVFIKSIAAKIFTTIPTFCYFNDPEARIPNMSRVKR